VATAVATAPASDMSRFANTVEQFYSVRTAAELLAVHPRTVSRLVKLGADTDGHDGIWPVLNRGPNTTRIPATSINRYVQRRMKWK
jgi:hypothetical protein